jgi:ABC-type cobalamin/Fe3+-siderophores transport system ATPase subunit
MIKQLTAKNWKSFEKATFYVDPLTILIGANASGKSNLLDAFLFLQRISANVGISQAVSGDVNLPPLRGGLEWVCRKPEDSFTIEAVVDLNRTHCILSQADALNLRKEVVDGIKKVMSDGSLGRLSFEGRIESALKMEAVA